MKGIENVSLVREQSSPKVFLIVGNTKFWITDPFEFSALGFDWSKVRVVDDGTLDSFTQQLLHVGPATRPSDVFIDCGQDHWAPEGNYYYNCQPSTSIIRKDVLIAGWLLSTPRVNNEGKGTPGVEDIHYPLLLDAVFLDRMYGLNGLSTALRGAIWPGNPPKGTAANIPFDYALSFAGDPSLHQDFNSWMLPGNNICALAGGCDPGGPGWYPNGFNIELNTWHTQNAGRWFHTWLEGRGQQPAGWVNPLGQDADAWFPFDPLDPEGLGQSLKQGDYLVMRGVLYEDIGHDPAQTTSSVWTLNYDGWGEIHPPDWIVRVSPPGPNARLTTSVMAATAGGDISIVPDFQPSGPTRVLRVRSLQRLLDSRFTSPLSGLTVQETPSPDNLVAGLSQQVDVQVAFEPGPNTTFKASWLVGWSEIDGLDQVWVDDQLPAGATPTGDGEGWNWSADNVFIGKLSHVSALAPGMHQHYFVGATSPMTVASGDTLFAMVYLDPDSPPDEVMLQWHTTDWLSRAYWGENLLDWGTDGTAQRHFMGPLPRAGEWVRLEVPATAVGLGGNPGSPSTIVNGMAFTLSGGRATWDYAGVSKTSILQ